MASSKLMMNTSSSTSRNSDLIIRKSSNSSASSTSTKTNNINSGGMLQMTLDGLSSNNNNNQQQQQQSSVQTSLLDTKVTLSDVVTDTPQQTVPTSSKSVDDVWKELVVGRPCKQEMPDEMMTLEDFLAKAGAVEEEDVKIPPPRLPSGGLFSFDNHPPNVGVDGFGIGGEEVGGRGKRRAILETLDKAAQQRQRRMIKNRESAARSRERKQAYQAELESLAVKLEEENEALLKVKTEQTRKRYKQLMDNIIPVTEKQKPRRYVLKKVRSMEW